MFETLVESGRQHRSSSRAGAVAFAVHVGIVVLAVNSSAGTTLLPPKVRPIEFPVYQASATTPDPVGSTPDGSIAPLPTLSTPDIFPGTISIDPIQINGTLPADPAAGLRASIRNGGREPGFSLAGTNPPGTGTFEGVLLAGEVDDPVRVLQATSPRYPRVLEAAGVPGRVVLQFVVDTLGRIEVGTLSTMEASDSAFAVASRAAIMATRFTPARVRGQPVRQLVRQTHLFRTEK